jgi:hypothetical protein
MKHLQGTLQCIIENLNRDYYYDVQQPEKEGVCPVSKYSLLFNSTEKNHDKISLETKQT